MGNPTAPPRAPRTPPTAAPTRAPTRANNPTIIISSSNRRMPVEMRLAQKPAASEGTREPGAYLRERFSARSSTATHRSNARDAAHTQHKPTTGASSLCHKTQRAAPNKNITASTNHPPPPDCFAGMFFSFQNYWPPVRATKSLPTTRRSVAITITAKGLLPTKNPSGPSLGPIQTLLL